eukprot:426937_1
MAVHRLMYLLVMIWYSFTVHAVWQSPSLRMPRSVGFSAVGWYNNTIVIIGSYRDQNSAPKQMMTYNIHTNQFIDYGETYVPQPIQCDGQAYAQMHGVLYMIYYDMVLTYDMKTKEFTADWKNVRLPDAGDTPGSGCLALSELFLYVMGGYRVMYGALDALNVLELTTYTWIPNAPSMITGRAGHACAICNDYLWVFGGNNENTYLSQNERININNITQNEWTITPPLAAKASYLRAVVSGYNIYIIGGTPKLGISYYDTVQIMDTTTVQITTSSERLPYEAAAIGVVSLGHAIYAFGGIDSGIPLSEDIDMWTWRTVPTSSPTTPSPTAIPSSMSATTTEPTDTTQATQDDTTTTAVHETAITTFTGSPSHIPTAMLYPTDIPSTTQPSGPTPSPFVLTVQPIALSTISVEATLAENTLQNEPHQPAQITISMNTVIIICIVAVTCCAVSICVVICRICLKKRKTWVLNRDNSTHTQPKDNVPTKESDDIILMNDDVIMSGIVTVEGHRDDNGEKQKHVQTEGDNVESGVDSKANVMMTVTEANSDQKQNNTHTGEQDANKIEDSCSNESSTFSVDIHEGVTSSGQIKIKFPKKRTKGEFM